jgi:hypothetical protein
MTDELASYDRVGKEFENHSTVNHSADEYVRLGGFVHVNTAECRFSLMKRAVFGTHHSISEAHLPRYLSENGITNGILARRQTRNAPQAPLRAQKARG